MLPGYDSKVITKKIYLLLYSVLFPRLTAGYSLTGYNLVSQYKNIKYFDPFNNTTLYPVIKLQLLCE